MFQFLIGKLRMKTSSSEGWRTAKFQFLIGKLRMFLAVQLMRTVYEFQFLIGKLRIVEFLHIACVFYAVSIPYR